MSKYMVVAKQGLTDGMQSITESALATAKTEHMRVFKLSMQ